MMQPQCSCSRLRTWGWWIVCQREVIVKLTNPAYLLSTFLSIALIIGATFGSAYLTANKGVIKIAALGSESVEILEETAHSDKMLPTEVSLPLTIVRVENREEVEKLLRDDEVDAALLPDENLNSREAWELIALNQPDFQLLSALTSTLHTREMYRLARVAHEDQRHVERATAVRAFALKSGSEYGFYRWVIGLIFAVLFYFSSLTYGVQLAQSVLEEKQSRIVEIIISTIPVRQLLFGKVIGNTAMAILQMLVLMGCGVICGLFTSVREILPIVGGASGWFLIMFLAGFFALSGLWASAGALCTRSEDLQYSTQPIMLALSLVFIIGATVQGFARSLLSYFPLFSTILMPIRLLDAEASWLDAMAALLISLAFGLCAIIIGDRIYQHAILQTGRRLKYREAFSLGAKEKNTL